MEKLATRQNLSLYGNDDGHQYLLASMGIAYTVARGDDEDGLWFVKLPITNGEPARNNAVMVHVDDTPTDHDEHPDERVPPEPVDDLLDWYSSLDN